MTLLIAPICGFAVIYGGDDILEVDQVPSPIIREQVQSVAAITRTFHKSKENTLSSFYNARTLLMRSICENERFVHQPIVSQATAFLIAPDLMMSVGHAVSSDDQCTDKMHLAFNYEWNSSKKELYPMKLNDIYSCTKILMKGYNPVDYVIFKLDRKVEGITPLSLSFDYQERDSETIYTLGYPQMLPQKYSKGFIRDNSDPNYYEASIDTFRGNSGSPVFNQGHQVIGILKDGEKDYVPGPSNQICNAYKRCEEDRCRGERITKIKALPTQEIKELIQESYLRNP